MGITNLGETQTMEMNPIKSHVIVVNNQPRSRFWGYLRSLFYIGMFFCGVLLLFHYLDFKDEYLIFCQGYPVGVCLTSNKSSCKNGSDIYSWSVHGIWPQYTNGKYPKYCQRIDFDDDVLEPIQTDLNKHWYSIYGDNQKFWEHEWSKHGTCAIDSTPLISEYDYFDKGLQWNKEFNIKDILASEDINPRDEPSYSIDAIHQAFISKLDVHVGIACQKQKNSSKQILIEVRMCFSVKLKLINYTLSDNCEGNQVYYPKTVTKFVELKSSNRDV